MEYKVVAHNSERYWKLVSLRDEILRKPLDLTFSEEELALENNQIHLGIFDNDKSIGSLSLVKNSNKELKMRQVCIASPLQGKGIGRKMVEFSEDFGKQKGFSKMVLHAREVAQEFYLALDYKIIGEQFEEVGIPHYKMEKLM